jgi:uncharacterized membrane protein YjjB (DUF3815 family)
VILQVLGAIFGVIWGSIYLEAPKKHLLMGGLIGGVGWLSYLISLRSFDLSLSTLSLGSSSPSYLMASHVK